jgi:hypothetical protein
MNNADTQTLWGRLVGILIFVIGGMVLWRGFLFFQNTDLSTYGFSGIPTRANQISKLNEQLAIKNQELEELKQSKEAVKYDIAQDIETKIEHPVWSDYINSLIEMYVQVRSIGKYATDAIELSDFVVDQKRIGLRGKVRKLDTIYQENGVIDKMIKLDFISNIEIPSYQKIENIYEFQIQWEVNTAKSKRR